MIRGAFGVSRRVSRAFGGSRHASRAFRFGGAFSGSQRVGREKVSTNASIEKRVRRRIGQVLPADLGRTRATSIRWATLVTGGAVVFRGRAFVGRCVHRRMHSAIRGVR